MSPPCYDDTRKTTHQVRCFDRPTLRQPITRVALLRFCHQSLFQRMLSSIRQYQSIPMAVPKPVDVKHGTGVMVSECFMQNRCVTLTSSSSAFALYIEHFAYHCGFYFAPFRPSNSDFGYIEEGESTSGYTFTPCVGSFACPGIDTQVQGISFKGRGNRSKVTCPRSQARWSLTGIEPTMYGS
jgi:hypothetical protein